MPFSPATRKAFKAVAWIVNTVEGPDRLQRLEDLEHVITKTRLHA
jgi:hypothetical protein